jgi:hypothetical protein
MKFPAYYGTRRLIHRVNKRLPFDPNPKQVNSVHIPAKTYKRRSGGIKAVKDTNTEISSMLLCVYKTQKKDTKRLKNKKTKEP